MDRDKSIYFRLPKIGNEGFVVQHDDLKHFYDQLHYHPELQLIYIIEGDGELFVGNSITSFAPNSLFLVGPNQSHIFKSDPVYFRENSDKRSRSISVFFHENSLGKGFFDNAETVKIKRLIQKADRSIKFHQDVAYRFGNRMENLLDKIGFDRFLAILSLLNEIAQTSKFKYLSSINNPHPPSKEESKKINSVINYILNNYRKDIPLKKIAEVANYSKAAFCRYFKKRTRKTFSQFLNEVRISKACKMLRNTELNISQIAFKSGYNNVSNFNRQFKRQMNMTPKSYIEKCNKLAITSKVIEYQELAESE